MVSELLVITRYEKKKQAKDFSKITCDLKDQWEFRQRLRIEVTNYSLPG